MLKSLACIADMFLCTNGVQAVCSAGPKAGEIMIQGAVKQTQGTIIRRDNGDAACYVTLKDTDGLEFHEMADFSVCEQKGLNGQRVKLFYEAANVLAADCEGDMDCGRSDTVILIQRLQVMTP